MSNTNSTRYHQDHDLVREEVVHKLGYRCKKCGIRWMWKPKHVPCLGVPRYQIRSERPEHLFTRKELERKHLKPGSEPEGYVHLVNAPYWIFLYDIGKAVPVKTR